ncbi:hypothetical protein ACFVHB_06060 [Kitasatospora sp. NPDC127111]|uniref:hypothetical protein n=1 Tax=Kitasatospora sp. NPDC127111 TaxID=3345363 RepID=UPI003636722F
MGQLHDRIEVLCTMGAAPSASVGHRGHPKKGSDTAVRQEILRFQPLEMPPSHRPEPKIFLSLPYPSCPTCPGQIDEDGHRDSAYDS